MNIYDRKAAALKVMTRDSEAVGKERYDEKQTRRSIVQDKRRYRCSRLTSFVCKSSAKMDSYSAYTYSACINCDSYSLILQ